MLRFLDIDCAMARAIRQHDWTGNPLGQPDQWPTMLKTTVGLILESRFPQCIVWGEELVTIPNDAFLPILGGKADALGRGFDEVWYEVWSEIAPIARRAFAGEATYIEDLPLNLERNGDTEEAWFTFCYSPIRDERGQVVGMLDTVIETSDKVRARRAVEIANRELAHRIKNTLSVFQAIAHQTFRGQNATADARERFDQRMVALASAQDLLLSSELGPASVEDLVRKALSPHLPEPGAARIEGPRVVIGGQQGLSLALAIHELATNAAKFGALSVPQGRVSIRWNAAPAGGDGAFDFEWRETGGPVVTPPKRTGFGTKLIARVLAADFRGEATLDYPPEGLRFDLRTAMRHLERE